jgi:hypothetical protein
MGMTTSTGTLERRLLEDLGALADRLAGDERFTRDLYAALAGYALHPRDGEGRLVLSWKRAEELISQARGALGLPPVEGLDQSGVEGRLTDRVREALESIGWELRPRPTDHQDPGHLSSDEDPPPSRTEPPQWEREAHAEAEAERHRQRLGETRRELHERHGV